MSVIRPPNFTVLLIWVPLVVFAAVVGYFKRENLHMLYDSRIWAVMAMVRERGREEDMGCNGYGEG